METQDSGKVAETEVTVKNEAPTQQEAPEKPAKELSFKEALRQEIKKSEGEEKPVKEAVNKSIEQKPHVKENIPPIVPPADMTPEEKEYFTKADPKLQNYLSRRAYENRAALSREMQKIQDRARYYEGIDKSIGEHSEYLNKLGVTPEAVVNRAIAWDKAINKDRINGAKEWLASYGIDPYELIDDASAPQQRQQQQQIDPSAIKEDILNEINERILLEQQQRATEEGYNAVEKFKNSKILFKDPNTALQLEQELAPIVESLVRQNPNAKALDVLETAYNYVTKGNEKYSTLLDAYNQREKAEQAKKESEKARLSGKSITGGLAGTSPTKQGLNFREELRLRMQGGM